MKVEFTKMHGAGNDFIFVEDLNNNLIGKEQELARGLCHRNFGIGADGLILIRKSDIAKLKMEIINSDGSPANMCGNAIRCFGRYVYDKDLIKDHLFQIETDDGIKVVELMFEGEKFDSVRVNMGLPSLDGKKIPLNNKEGLFNEEIKVYNSIYKVSTMLMGVPHTVIIDNEEKYTLSDGKKIEKFHLFKEGTNVNFIKVVDKSTIKVWTWERGAGATLACGTGCCASVYYTSMEKLTSDEVKVIVPGGEIYVEVTKDGVYMRGNANYICSGTTY